jgi:putative ABC transport system permease protein
MRVLRVLRQRARSLFRGAAVDAELENELAYHLEQLTKENIAAGMDSGAARLAARRALGGVAQIAEQCRDQRRMGWFTDLQKDIAYAWRMLAKSPGFTALAVVTLALGVGASIAVYALAEALLVRSLPYPSPERLVSISSIHVRRGEAGVGQEDFRDWQASNTVFERMAFTEFSQVTLTGQGDAERIDGRTVSEGFFEMLGVPPELGRWWTPEEQKPGADRVVLLSHAFWVRKMGARPDVVGRTIFANDHPYRITGVMPESFRFNEGYLTDYWTPISYRNYGHQNHQYAAYGRLKPGVSIQMAQAQMSEIARRMEKEFPDCVGWGVGIQSLRSAFLGELSPALAIFAAAALIVLLVACGNVASLLLARGLGRSKEIAVRMAMGAGRRRVVRLLLTESLLLSCLGAVSGVGLAFWLLRLAIAAAPPWLQLGAMVSVSPSLAAFAIALTVCTGLLTGLWPALRGSRADLQNDLKESGNSLVAGRRQVRALNSLVVMEIALAVVLLTFAGLLVKSFAYLLHTGLGYRTDHVLTFRMPLPSSRYRSDRARLQFWDKLLPQLAAMPGVVSAAASDGVPLGGTYSGMPVEVEGQADRRDWADVMVRAASVTPDYFRTMGIPLLAGRGFNAGDTAEAEPVAIVNEAFLRKLMPDASPLDKRVRLSGGKWQRIVGVIGDSRYNGPSQPIDAEAYTPFAQDAYAQFVALRTAVPEESVLGAVRNTIRGLDPGLALTQVRSMRESVDLAMSLSREMMALVAGFAALTLGMATLGLGGVMAYAVSRRKREIGLRMALGARRSDVSRAVIGDASRLIAVGSALGVLGALAAARVLESLLYGVRPHDPVIIAAAPVVLGGLALLACLAPAHRAASVEPMAALRQE